MGSVNKVILVGNLGRDAEVRYTQGGAAVATLNMATTEVWNDRTSGQRQERTEWHRVVVWGKQAETLSEYLLRGKQIYVEGRLQTRQWDDRDGNKRYTTEVRADRVVLLSGRGGEPGRGREQGSAQPGDGREQGGAQPGDGRDQAAPGPECRRGAERGRYSFLGVRGETPRPTLPFRRPPIAIFQPHHVVEFRRRYLDDVAVLDRCHPMDGARWNVYALAVPHLPAADLVTLPHLEQQPSAPDENGLVLAVVILQTQCMAGFNVDHLPHVPIRLCPVALVAPRLSDMRRIPIVHANLPGVAV